MRGTQARISNLIKIPEEFLGHMQRSVQFQIQVIEQCAEKISIKLVAAKVSFCRAQCQNKNRQAYFVPSEKKRTVHLVNRRINSDHGKHFDVVKTKAQKATAEEI